MSKNKNIAILRINKEYENLKKNKLPNIIAKPSASNLFVWNFLIFGLKDCPYEGGIYHGKLVLPSEYPFKPPTIEFITPSGRFKPGDKICMSFTHFHTETWSSAWNIEKMLLATLSFMTSNEHTTGGVLSSVSEKKRFAKFSILSNLRNREFLTNFLPYFEEIGIDKSLLEPNNFKQYSIQLQRDIGMGNQQESLKILLVALGMMGLIIAFHIYTAFQN